MFPNALYQYPIWTILLTAFLVNIPMGYIRGAHQKFSLKWLFWIHASIPLIVYLRVELGTSKLLIPGTIFLAVVGQVWGSRWRTRQMTNTELEEYERISNLRMPYIKPCVNDRKVMVTLLNMGGPRTNADVPDFQRRLFRDPILIRFPLSTFLQPLFTWLLIKFRGEEAKKRYRLIGGGSPIFDSTRAQAEAVKRELNRRGRNLDVTFSFNYSHPLPDETIAELKQQRKEYILPLSLYPHYSTATTGSNLFYLKKTAQKLFPQLVFLNTPEYYLHESYIQGFVGRIYEQLRPGEELDDFYLLFSAHGLPLYFLAEGDPYVYQVAQTVSAIMKQLRRKESWSISYQSAVGPLEWIKPSTDSVLNALGRREIKKIIIVPISFVTDHIETTCEIDIEYRQRAEKLGIDDFRMTKALECHPSFITALADAVESILPRIEKQKEQTAVDLPVQSHI